MYLGKSFMFFFDKFFSNHCQNGSLVIGIEVIDVEEILNSKSQISSFFDLEQILCSANADIDL